jgi:hypothetical protein
MANRDYVPHKDADLKPWVLNLSAKLTATPVAFGVTAAQATALAALVTTWVDALAVVEDPATKTRAAIAAKNAARAPLKAEARELARIINAFPSITNEQRIELGLTPRDGTISPINPPTECPSLRVVSAIGRILKIKLQGQDTSRRGKPEGVAGATLFSFVGDEAPADIGQWKFEGSITRTEFDIEFAPSVAAGAKVWLCAFWFSPRSQSGPACEPVAAYIAGGVSAEAA